MKRKTRSSVIKTKTQTAASRPVASQYELKSSGGPAVKKKLEHIGLLVREIAGEEGLQIVSCFRNSGVTDDYIEKSTGMKIAEVRTVLNHLHSYGLVEYTREKNMQTGWFTYTWKLNLDRALQNFITMKHREYETMKSKLLSGEETQIYRCNRGCACIGFEKALEFTFKCPGCNTKLLLADQNIELKKLEEKLQALNAIRNLSSDTTSIQPAPAATSKAPAFIGKEVELARR